MDDCNHLEVFGIHLVVVYYIHLVVFDIHLVENVDILHFYHKDEEIWQNNADLYIHSGVNLSRSWNLSLYAGYAGVGDIHKVLPVSIRATRYFGKDPLSDRWFAFTDLGSGICFKRPVQEILTGKIGGGYRMSLSRYSKLDFIISARMTYTHPQITYDQEIISHDMVRRNNAYVSALSLGIGLTF